MIPLFKPYMPANIDKGIKEILYSDKLSFGKWGYKFEEELKHYLGTKNLLVVDSHSSAINIVLTVFDIKLGDEIIMSPMCCLRSTQPLVAFGIRIIWADIDPTTGTLSPDSVKRKITPKTKAIFHNHHLGYVGYINEINDIAKEKGIFVIDDCIDGIGAKYKGKMLGNVGSDATVISFDAVRLPNAINGGAVVFDNKSFIDTAIRLRDLGIDRKIFRTNRGEINPNCDISTVGFCAMINEINAFIGYKQMIDLKNLLKKQKNNADSWYNFIKRNNLDVQHLKVISNTEPNYWVFGLLSNQRDMIIDYFRDKNFYSSQVHLNNNRYSVFKKQDELKGVNEFYNKFLAVPSGWWVNKEEIWK